MSSPGGLQFTPAQEEAITSRGNLVVSAGAGTGKTRTLVERCLRLLREGASLDRMLLVTFTEAAAAEMRSRIRLALQNESATWAQEQAALLETASISTLHAFCLTLVRDNFYRLGLDPMIHIMDDSIARPLQEDTLDELFENFYKDSSVLAEQIRVCLRQTGREENLRHLLLKIHTYTRTLPSPSSWLTAQNAEFQSTEPKAWLLYLREGLRDWVELNLPFIATRSEIPNARRCASLLADFLNQTNPDDSEWTHSAKEFLGCLVAVDEEGWTPKKKGEERKHLKALFEDAQFFLSLLQPSPTNPEVLGIREDWEWSRHGVLAILEAAQQFSTRYAEAKRNQGALDFTDLEQFSLQLLYQNGVPTSLAHDLQQHFQFIFVDEYQDINEAQDAILTAVSGIGSKANRFLVGDVKQSIYRFRLANPRIFAGYEKNWHSPLGKKIFLSENFRSHEGILQFANDIFQELMTDRLGGAEYRPEIALHYGHRSLRAARTEALPGGNVEIHWISRSGESADSVENESPEESAIPGAFGCFEDVGTTEKEARVIAQRLVELKQSGATVWKEGVGFQPVEWGDMVILSRGLTGRLEIFAKIFHVYGIPFAAPRPGFFGAFEIQDLLHLLRLLDNPLQDFSLLTVLRSPLVGMSPDELATIRVSHRMDSFWTTFQMFLRKNSALPAQLSGFVKSALEKGWEFERQFNRWRNLVQQTCVSRCLETILAETRYETVLAAHPRGGELLGNVSKLLRLAHEYDPYQRQGLYRFLRHVDLQEEMGLETDSASAPPLNAVQFSSIHKSKGLEFPVVVLAGLGNRFNLQDTYASLLLDERYGICPRIYTPDGRRRYKSITQWLAAEKGLTELRSEELRLLYVALTRAKDRLILTGVMADKNLDATWGMEVDAGLLEKKKHEAGSFADWIRVWLTKNTRPQHWTSASSGSNAGVHWFIHREFRAVNPVPSSEQAPAMQDQDWADLKTRLGKAYPWKVATQEPAKTSLTAVRRRLEDEDSSPLQYRAKKPVFPSPHEQGSRGIPAPATQNLNALKRGVAHHKFLQSVRITSDMGSTYLEAEKIRMVKAEWMTSEEGGALNLSLMEKFWSSELGLSVARQVEFIQRELNFTARITGEDWISVLGEKSTHAPWLLGLKQLDAEFVVVQGAIDLAVLLPKEIWILDFKTDRLDSAETLTRAQQYRPQLLLYALALSRIYERPVTRKFFYFLECSVCVEI